MIYNLLKIKIEKGNFNKEQLLKKIDVYLLNNRITENNYKELISLIEIHQQK